MKNQFKKLLFLSVAGLFVGNAFAMNTNQQENPVPASNTGGFVVQVVNYDPSLHCYLYANQLPNLTSQIISIGNSTFKSITVSPENTQVNVSIRCSEQQDAHMIPDNFPIMSNTTIRISNGWISFS